MFRSLLWALGAFSCLVAVLVCPVLSVPAFADVSALGRIEPRNGVRTITAPSTPETGLVAVVARLEVAPGDDVKQGQLLAVTDAASLLEAMLVESRTALELARQELAAEEAGAKATCVLAEVTLREAERRDRLVHKKLSSVEEAERAHADAEFQAASCEAANVSVDSARARVALASSQVDRRQTALNRAFIRAPIDGVVLDVSTWPGETVGTSGILELAEVGQMFVIAEIYETDVRFVKPGQAARITSPALPATLTGRVTHVRPFVRKQDVVGTDPAARKDARIVEVEIAVAESAAVAALTNLQVEVIIDS